MTRKPELLAPAGTREALDAAIREGADAVYFGGSRFNARMFADNFAGDAMGEAIRACAFYGVKSNITLNTMPYEKEQADVLRYAEQLCRWGADAVICADLGTAALLHRYFPTLALHASTQCMGHSTDAARFFAEQGFSRMVAARELSFDDLKRLCADSPIETELFIHGAICVSQSGGCLFSSMVGGRSGNRGACAQPCRLPYTCTLPEGGVRRREEHYPLSLRDMCLTGHIPELLSLGAASFKIEGRMKSPAYVAGVVRIYRRLLDEGRNADEEELALLAALFSRNGFTDGYFTKKIGRAMQGTRSENDKAATSEAEKRVLSGRTEPKRLPVSLCFSMRAGMPCTLTVTKGDTAVTVTGDVPAPAENRATTADDIRKNLAKLGSTPFSAGSMTVSAGDGLSFPLSSVNAMRRDASERLEALLRTKEPYPERTAEPPLFEASLPEELTVPRAGYAGEHPYKRQAFFLFVNTIPKEASSYYDLRFLPLERFHEAPEEALARGINGVSLPPVIFDRETSRVRTMLALAKERGVVHAQISNAGHIALARDCGFVLHGDFRFNLYTGLSADVLARAGLSDAVLSAELSAAQLRDVSALLPTGAVTYGRLPLMTLERCILREETRLPDGAPCNRCAQHPVSILSDRRRTEFPVTRAFVHRNIIWNSAPVYLADKPELLARLRVDFTLHLFTVESAAEAGAVLRAYRDGTDGIPYAGFPQFRRIQN